MKKYMVVFVDGDGLECYKMEYSSFDEIPSEFKKVFEEMDSFGVKIVDGSIIFEVV